jgi:hypothetical protein
MAGRTQVHQSETGGADSTCAHQLIVYQGLDLKQADDYGFNQHGKAQQRSEAFTKGLLKRV